MFAILGHVLPFEDARQGQQPTHHRQLENHTDDQAHRDQRVGIRLDGEHVGYVGTYLIGAQKAHCEGENDEIVDGCPDDEHDITAQHYLHSMATLMVVEGRGHKSEQQVDDIGGGDQQTTVERQFHMYHELLRQPRVHQV